MNQVYNCPFCGYLSSLSVERNDEYADESYPERDLQYQVVCDVNDGGCGASSGFYTTKDAAVTCWNTRHFKNEAFTKPV